MLISVQHAKSSIFDEKYAKWRYNEYGKSIYQTLCIHIEKGTITMLFFPRIRDLREDHDKTQKEICEYLYCDQSLYSKYERGLRIVPVEVIIKLAQYYGTSTDYLLGLTDNKKPYK